MLAKGTEKLGTIPTVTKTGYEFDKWTTVNDGSETVEVTENSTLWFGLVIAPNS